MFIVMVKAVREVVRGRGAGQARVVEREVGIEE